MQYTITNDLITLTVDEQACEMHSLKRNDSDYEYLWQGNPEFWSGRNPTLFPLVGSTADKKIFFKDNYYEMKNHGLARYLSFTLIRTGKDYLEFELKQSQETLDKYPYNFRLQMKYQLEEYKVNVLYKIINDNDEEMPFCFGLHPAFNIDLNQNPKIELSNEDDVIVEDSLFEKYGTYVLNPTKSSWAKLITGNKELKVNFDGFPILAIWKPLKAPFVCIEPWHSASLTMSGIKAEEFVNWKWTIKLNKHETWSANYSIELVK